MGPVGEPETQPASPSVIRRAEAAQPPPERCSYTDCVCCGHSLPDGEPPRGEASAEASAEAPLAAWPSGSISEAPFGG